MSQLTDTLTKISRDFVFDRLLWASKVYKDAAPGLIDLVKERARRQTEARRQVLEEARSAARSQTIDKHLAQELAQARKVTQVLVMGKDSSLANTFITFMKINGLGLSSEDTELIQNYMRRAVARLMDMSLCFVRERGLAIADYIDQLNVESQSQALTDPTEAGARALQGLWSNEQFREAVLKEMDSFPSWAEWIVERADQITQTDYVPSDMDCLRVPQTGQGIRKAELDIGQLTLRLFNMAGQQSNWKKVIHQFENVTSIIFIVDLSRYTEGLEWSTQNGLMESISHFDSVVNSRWCTRSSIILLLSNLYEFKQKLARDPLSNYFPDYSGGRDWNKAAKYISWRFKQVNRAHLNLYSHLSEIHDNSLKSLISAAVMDTHIHNGLKAAGIL
ncbi:guanine nucleotide regulatory protein [Ilyonectria destructans]|nr:guanine nucleotide regulatory protein [Ilyonectria destructans]